MTLLLANSVAMETLPLFLDQLVSEFMAILISVTAVLIFGEILPQAICTGPSQMRVAAAVAPVTKGLMIVEWIVAYPIAKLLDCVLGEHTKSRYQNKDLKTLIELHSSEALKALDNDEQLDNMGLDPKQTELIRGAIDLTDTTAAQIMTKYDDVETVYDQDAVSLEFLAKLKSLGYTRYPVHCGNRHEVIGILNVKRLIGLRDFGKPLREYRVPLRRPLVIPPNKTLIELLVEFQIGHSHVALVTEQGAELEKHLGSDPSGVNRLDYADFMNNNPITILGIITLEDVIEQVLGG